MLIGIAVVAWALVGTGPATAGSASWAVQANAVCKTQKAKTRVVRARLQKTVQPLIRHQPLTHAQWSYVLHTSLQLLRVRLRELERVPSPVPPLGQRALRLTRLNVAELARATQAFEKGNSVQFVHWFGVWAGDARADPVWRTLGASQCI
jgi:hypothetical protein